MIAGAARAAGCPGNPEAIGTSRTIVVDPAEHRLLGGLQYRESLPLHDNEVVLTFDDGPLPPYSTRVLDILAKECVKATYFMVGRMARAYPELARRAYEEGHTIANHSQNHSYAIHRMPIELAAKEIEDGFESLRAVLGEPAAVAPFFRFPGLRRHRSVEQYLATRDVMSWSVDFMADDWRRIGAADIVSRALARLESKRKGILLLHDIKPAPALALPTLLHELKIRGYRIVHVVPAGPGRIKTAAPAELWQVRGAIHQPEHDVWPAMVAGPAIAAEPVLQAPSLQSFGVVSANPVAMVFAPSLGSRRGSSPASVRWPQGITSVAAPDAPRLPAPAMDGFYYLRLSTHHKSAARRSRAAAVKSTTAAKGASAMDASVKAKERARTPRRENAKLQSAGQPGQHRSGHQMQLPKPHATLWNSLRDGLTSLVR
jgi:peptidoglycan/xylan/chitin deacetylase (PgdA/CDA1 family)